MNSVDRKSTVASIEASVHQQLSDLKMCTGCRLGMGSHADTCCSNEHAYVEQNIEGITVDAIPFDDSLGKATNLYIIHAIYTVDDPITFQTYLIRICNSIYIPHMKTALLCPNQARAFGTIVDDVPPEYGTTGTSRFAKIIAPDEDNTTFPLQ